VLIDSKAGLGIRRVDGFCRYNTLPRMAVGVEISENEIAEEMRVLYVALTRAKEKLKIYWSAETMKSVVESFSKEKVGQHTLELIEKKLE
jgi:ATP-dependent exoDNAse (exonuclease V) beta subunit